MRGQWRATPAEVAAGADILITMLPGSREVREVMAGSGGVLAAMSSTAVWVDMTSSSPAAGRELAAAARTRGVGVLDAPVGGGVPAARAGTLQVFVGGDAAVLDRCPVLEALADPQRIIRVGGNGAGYTVKLLVNLLWFGQAVATGEALLLGRRAGIDLDVLRQTLATSAASTAFMSFQHLIANTVPFVFMGLIIALRGAARLAFVTLIVIVIGGFGTWLVGPANTSTVGASGVVFGYAAYLISRGFFDRSLLELFTGAIVGLVWGGALLSSVVPHYGVSWQGHVCGAIAGLVAAWLLRRERPPGERERAWRRFPGTGQPAAHTLSK